MVKSKSLFFLAALIFPNSLTQAGEDHGLGRIRTKTMDLSYIDHVLSGRIGDVPVYARPLAEGFGMRLLHRAGGQDFESVLRKDQGVLQESVLSLTKDGERQIVKFEITRMDAEAQMLEGTLNKKKFRVDVSSQEMKGHHFINPHFRVSSEGETVLEFDLENSQACMGCVARLSFVILSLQYLQGNLF